MYLGMESRMVWEGLFTPKNPKDLLESKMGDVGKIRRWDAEEGRRGNKKEHNYATVEMGSEKKMESLKGKAEETLCSPPLWGL